MTFQKRDSESIIINTDVLPQHNLSPPPFFPIGVNEEFLSSHFITHPAIKNSLYICVYMILAFFQYNHLVDFFFFSPVPFFLPSKQHLRLKQAHMSEIKRGCKSLYPEWLALCLHTSSNNPSYF